MARSTKVIATLIAKRPLTFTELTRSLEAVGYRIDESGAGSRVCFERRRADGTTHRIRLHKPHPGNEVQRYAIKQVLAALKAEELL